MALRDYMQDLLRSQTRGEDQYAGSDPMHIIIVDDNSCSSIPDEYDDIMLANRSMSDLPFANSSTRTLNSTSGGERDESTYDSRRTMLDGFRQRKRFLRETQSPNTRRLSSRSITESPLSSSSSPIITRFTPIDCKDNEVSQQPNRNDSQRGRMYRLKTNRQIQERNSSPPLL